VGFPNDARGGWGSKIPFSLSTITMYIATRKEIHRYPLLCLGRKAQRLNRDMMPGTSNPPPKPKSRGSTSELNCHWALQILHRTMFRYKHIQYYLSHCPLLKYRIPPSHRPRSRFINFVQTLRFSSFLYRIHKTILRIRPFPSILKMEGTG